MNGKYLSPVEIAMHLGSFVSRKYDYEKWDQTTTEKVAKVVCEITDDCLSLKLNHMKIFEANVALTIYRKIGILPSRFDSHGQWSWWEACCQNGDDDLVFRMLMDGFDYKRRVPGFKSARNYVQKNRQNLPKTWSYFCQEDLAKKAAKVRKRSWAGGTYTERAM